MTPTEKAKRSDALFNDRTKRELADMVVHREADLEDARAENDELWASNERMGLKAMAAIGEVQEENERLKSDNDKLRELAAGIGHLLFPLDVDYCATCPRDDINHPCPVYTVKGGECLYKTDLRELGIEVDDGQQRDV